MQDLPHWAAVVVSLLTLAWTVWYTRRKADQEAIGKVYARIEDLDLRGNERANDFERRLTKLESDGKHNATGADIHRIEISVLRVEGELGRIAESIKPIGAIAGRWQEMLIEQAEERGSGR